MRLPQGVQKRHQRKIHKQKLLPHYEQQYQDYLTPLQKKPMTNSLAHKTLAPEQSFSQLTLF